MKILDFLIFNVIKQEVSNNLEIKYLNEIKKHKQEIKNLKIKLRNLKFFLKNKNINKEYKKRVLNNE